MTLSKGWPVGVAVAARAVTGSRRPVFVRWTAVLLAASAVVGAAALILAGHRVDHPVLRSVLTALSAAAFLAGGLLASRSRPGNRTGLLMVLCGFALLAGSLTGTATPLPFTVGVITAPMIEAVLVHLLLAFPDGHLHSKVERVIVWTAYLTTTVVQLIMLLFMDYRTVPGCPCPRNLLFTVSDMAVHQALMSVQQLVGVVLVVSIVTVLVRRWRAATLPMRRSLSPVLATGTLAALLAGASLVCAQLSRYTAATDLGLAASLALAFVPLGFLAGLLRSRLARAAVGELVVELGRTMAPGRLRDALARALGDPSLRLAYRLPDEESYVDLDGHRVDLPPDGGPVSVTYVERDGQRIAAVLHDAALVDNRALVDAACAAAGLALQNERLQAELRARLEDLRTSRARIVTTGDTERRRLERNLHDGAQQRIVSVSFALGLAESRLPDDPQGARTILAGARQELTLALEELRELARGIHPAILTTRGLRGALEALAMTAALPVDVAAPAERLPEPVEAAAYYLVAEAVTNATKYAAAQGVSVAVARQDGGVLVTVSDDGIGGADPAGGSGLRGLADRMAALDGQLTVSSPAGGGTTIRASIPCV